MVGYRIIIIGGESCMIVGRNHDSGRESHFAGACPVPNPKGALYLNYVISYQLRA